MTIDKAHTEGKWVGLCGELAGESLGAPLLLGLGLDEFSMSPARVPEIKKIMQKLHKEDCKKLADEVLQMVDAQSVMDRCRSFLTEHGMEI